MKTKNTTNRACAAQRRDDCSSTSEQTLKKEYESLLGQAMERSGQIERLIITYVPIGNEYLAPVNQLGHALERLTAMVRACCSEHAELLKKESKAGCTRRYCVDCLLFRPEAAKSTPDEEN